MCACVRVCVCVCVRELKRIPLLPPFLTLHVAVCRKVMGHTSISPATSQHHQSSFHDWFPRPMSYTHTFARDTSLSLLQLHPSPPFALSRSPTYQTCIGQHVLIVFPQCFINVTYILCQMVSLHTQPERLNTDHCI